MSISNATLLSAIRGLEDAVYFKDCRGRYASLPDNNSMRIDLLSGRVSELAKMIEDAMGGDITVQQALQSLYDREGSAGDGSTDIIYDRSKDGFVKYMNDDVEPADYTANLTRYPNVFKYIYEELNYLFEHLFERENELDVYEDMITGYN